jgi:hypothetical protein
MTRENDGSAVGATIFLVVMAGRALHQQSATIQRRLMTWTKIRRPLSVSWYRLPIRGWRRIPHGFNGSACIRP